MIVLVQDGLLGDGTIVVYVLVFCGDTLDWCLYFVLWAFT